MIMASGYMYMIIISGGQVGVEGVAARAVFEANQSGISEKTFQSLKKLDRGHMRLPEHKNIAQLQNMITLKSVDP